MDDVGDGAVPKFIRIDADMGLCPACIDARCVGNVLHEAGVVR